MSTNKDWSLGTPGNLTIKQKALPFGSVPILDILKERGIEVRQTADGGIWIYSDRVLETHEIDFIRDLLTRESDV